MLSHNLTPEQAAKVSAANELGYSSADPNVEFIYGLDTTSSFVRAYDGENYSSKYRF